MLQEDEITLYQTAGGKVELQVRLGKETVWLTQAQMAALFGRDQSVISRHIRNVFSEGEVSEKSNMQEVHIANSDKPVALYDLDVVISVGYRIKSSQGVQFRRWVTLTTEAGSGMVEIVSRYTQTVAGNGDRHQSGGDHRQETCW